MCRVTSPLSPTFVRRIKQPENRARVQRFNHWATVANMEVKLAFPSKIITHKLASLALSAASNIWLTVCNYLTAVRLRNLQKKDATTTKSKIDVAELRIRWSRSIRNSEWNFLKTAASRTTDFLYVTHELMAYVSGAKILSVCKLVTTFMVTNAHYSQLSVIRVLF